MEGRFGALALRTTAPYGRSTPDAEARNVDSARLTASDASLKYGNAIDPRVQAGAPPWPGPRVWYSSHGMATSSSPHAVPTMPPKRRVLSEVRRPPVQT